MERKISIKKTEEKCSCDGCGIKNQETENKTEDMFEISLSSLSFHLCPSCLFSLISLSSSILNEKEVEEKEEREKEYWEAIDACLKFGLISKEDLERRKKEEEEKMKMMLEKAERRKEGK